MKQQWPNVRHSAEYCCSYIGKGEKPVYCDRSPGRKIKPGLPIQETEVFTGDKFNQCTN